jgi:hypothetical protein
MKLSYLHIGQSNAAANVWPDWLDKEKSPELLFVTNSDEERIVLPARATKVLQTNRQEISSYNAGFRNLYEEVNYSGLEDFFNDVQVRSGDNARQAILVAEPTELTRKRPNVPKVRRVHDKGDGEGAPLTADIQTKVLIMDIDSGTIPGLCVPDPIPSVRAALSKLDQQFQQVGLVVQLTAKQDPNADETLRGRVYVELSRPIHRLQQKWWQSQFAQKAPELNIDLGIMDSARVIYIAPPIFVADKNIDALLNPEALAVTDPLNDRRWFYDDGPPIAVPENLPKVSEIQHIRRATGETGGGGVATGLPYLTEGEELSLFDKGDDLHPRILAVSFWLIIRGGDPDQVAADITDYIRKDATGPLRARLEEAPGRLANISKEVLDAAQGAAERFTSDRQLIHGVLPWCARNNELSPEEGVAEVKRIVADVFRGENERVMLGGAAGLGKSYEAALETAATAQRVDVYQPTHDLIVEQKLIFQGVGCDNITILSGRTRSGCTKSKPIKAVTENLDLYPLTTAQLCGAKDAEILCPAFNECKYAQERLEADVFTQTVFRTTSYLSHDPTWLEDQFEDDVSKPDIVIADEDLSSSAVSVLSVPMNELFKTGLLGRVFHDALLQQNKGVPFLEALEDSFQEHRDRWILSGQSVPIMFDEISDDTSLFDVVDDKWRSLKSHRQGVVAAASMNEKELADAVEKAPGGFVYFELIRAIRRCLLGGHERWNGAYEYMGQAKVIVRHHLSRLKRRNQSVLMIDATASPLITEALLPKTEFVNICVRRNAHVIQVYDHTFSYKWLSEEPARLQDVGAFVRLHGKFMNPGVGHPKERLGDMFEVEGVTSVTFGKERGINKLKDCDIGFVVSRVHPSAIACEEIARGIWPHEDLDLTGEYIRMPMGYNMRDGRSVGIMGWAHKDQRVNAVLKLKREAGLEQMLDRFRLIHNSQPKLVYVFTNQPFNVVVDELVKLDDAIGPARLMRLVEEYYPKPLPLLPKHLALKHPDLFKGVSGATKFCTQVRKWMAKNEWRSPIELVYATAPANGGRRGTMLRVRRTPIIRASEHCMVAEA